MRSDSSFGFWGSNWDRRRGALCGPGVSRFRYLCTQRAEIQGLRLSRAVDGKSVTGASEVLLGCAVLKTRFSSPQVRVATSYWEFLAIPNVGAGGTSPQLRLRVPTPHITLFIADSSRSINKAAESRNGTTRRLNPERDCLKLATSSRLRGSVEDASGPREG